MSSTFNQRLKSCIQNGYQAILVTTHEEHRCIREITRSVSGETGRNIVLWDQLTGFSHNTSGQYRNAIVALQAVAQPNEQGLPLKAPVIFRDLHNFYSESDVRRTLRSIVGGAAANNSRWQRPIIIIQPTTEVHPDLERVLHRLDFLLPTELDHAHGAVEEALTSVCKSCQENLKRDKASQGSIDAALAKILGTLPGGLRNQLGRALCGLTHDEAVNCLFDALGEAKGVFSEALLTQIEVLKGETIKRSELLTYTPRIELANIQLGCFGNAERYCQRLALAYTDRARELGLDLPKGLALVGVQGTGKTEMAKVIARICGMPLVEWNFSATFNKYVGESERRLRETIDVVSSMNGAVLLIDEIDKVMGADSGDSGVSQRLFGMLLTWLSKKKDRTLPVVAANRITHIPPEFFRRGRFDEIFFTDLPSLTGRKTILDIHLQRRGVATSYTNPEREHLANLTSNMVGAEIEQVVVMARLSAFQESEGRTADPTVKQLSAAAKEGQKTMLWNTSQEDVKAIQKFGQERAQPADDSTDTPGQRMLNLDMDFSGNN